MIDSNEEEDITQGVQDAQVIVHVDIYPVLTKRRPMKEISF